MHILDSQYQVQALKAVETLLQGSGGVFSRIPESYARHLTYTYSDGDISLLNKINTFEFTEELEDWQILEAIEMLAKVHPDDWSEPDHIAYVNLDEVYFDDEAGLPYDTEDFSEVSDLEYGNKVGRVFKGAIEHVLGKPIDHVGTAKGDGPNKNNQYCKDGDAFRGTFEHDGKSFEFELCKDEKDEWHLAYKLTKSSRDKILNDTVTGKGGKK